MRMLGVPLEIQCRSQSPRYHYPAAETGNTDLWDKAFHLVCAVKPEVQESFVRLFETWSRTHAVYMAERFILVVRSCRWIR